MKLGRRAPHPESTHPRLKLGPALRLDQITIPPTTDYLSAVPDWPMYLNDQVGDCTIAAAGHMIEAWTAYGQGATVEVTDQDILTAYSAVSGYDPRTGQGDNGAVMQDVLDYWRQVGIGGHRILAFAQLDISNPAELDAALYLFGHVYLGINCPRSAQEQYAAGQPWDVVADDGGIAGGHAIDLGYEDPDKFKIVSWGRAIEMTDRFRRKYVEEAWVVVDQEWINTTGGSPAGLDVAALNAQYEALYDQPGPFPVGPSPHPPAPTPDCWAKVRALWADIRAAVDGFFDSL